jgi:putative transposase
LGTGKLSRSTVADANRRRPVGIFAQTFARLSAMADRQMRCEGAEMVRLIDSSPIPLGKVCDWATWNGRIRGMKLHVVYDPLADVPMAVEVTPANVNDVEIGREVPIKAGATYVFDKGYCRFDWWWKINDSKALFVTGRRLASVCVQSSIAPTASARATASASSLMTRSSSSAKATRGCRSRCDASRSDARPAA